MDINSVFPSRFVKAHELQGSSPTVTIDRVEFEDVRKRAGVGTERKAIVYFKNKAKGLLLNRTNARSLIAIAHSSITEDWTGVKVQLYVTTASFGSESFEVIRIKAPAIASAPRPSGLPKVFTDELEIDLDDAGVRR